MRPHRLLAALAGLLAVAHLVGRAYDSPLLPAADALAWFAAAGYALTAPAPTPRTRYGLTLAAVALGVVALPAGGEPQFGWTAAGQPAPDPGDLLRSWSGLLVAGIGLAVAVLALPKRAVDRRRTAVAVALAGLVVLAGALALAHGGTRALPAYALPTGLAAVVLHRSGAVPVVLGLVLAGVAALDPSTVWLWLSGPPEPEPGLAFLSVGVRYAAPAERGSLEMDVLWGVAAVLVLAGCRWAEGVPRRAHGAARPGS
ncbi:hypothetical protein [Micromonospora sp. NPDC005806]|uniref:hypothetical protein n=1 Tax=Micromonospora sp. NPDC005806 TaxID=3364234 RepID=UPI0036737CE6